MFEKLNLPEYHFRIRQKDDKYLIFDPIRKKFIILTPEEWVRQHYIMYLIHEKKVPESLISIEHSIQVNGLAKRADILVYSKLHMPELIVECKAPNIKTQQATFDQAARYNIKLKTNYLCITNGLEHFQCEIDHQNKSYQFLQNLPEFMNWKGNR